MGLLDWLRRPSRPTDAAAPAGAPQPAPQTVAATDSGYAVVDVETTGFFPGRDRIIEIAVVRTDTAGQVLDEWTTLVNPGMAVGASHIHGITTTDVRGAPKFGDILGELTARLAGRALVAHNAKFDLAFLRTEYARAGCDLPHVPTLCTMNASLRYLPDLPRRRLVDCCWACGIELVDAHSALEDARAAAALLAFYLDPSRGVPPAPVDLELPRIAAQITWPAVQPAPMVAVPRRPRGEAEPPAPPGRLWELLDDLPLSEVVDEGAPTTATAYLELLFEVLEDGVLTESEAQSLVEVAGAFSLTRAQVEATHRAFLLALAHRIVEDGRVTNAERRLLRDAARALGAEDDLLRKVLDEARAALDRRRGEECRPLPAGWKHGEPLRVGQSVAFTGCDPLVRARLEGRAQAAGLRVTGSVSRRTAVLVADGANPHTTKAIRARAFGTRTVSPGVFEQLVEYVQPADAAPTVGDTAFRTDKRRETAASDAAPGGTTADPDPVRQEPHRVNVTARSTSCESRETDDPTTIRAWARRNGYTVGVRGRIPQAVRKAYRAAQSGARQRS